MEADDGRAQLFHHLGHRGVEGRAIGHRHRRRRVEPERRVVGREGGPPRSLARRIGCGQLVAEEVQVEWRLRHGPDRGRLGADLIGRERGAGKGAEPARPANGSG
jgi:hypothetical protein